MCQSVSHLIRWVRNGALLGLLCLPLQASTEEVARLIANSRREGQVEDLKKAEELLAPFLKSENPSEKILLLHATILQRNHHFKEALIVLKQVLQRNPKSAEAWLIQSTIQTVMGKYEKARKSAIPLFALAPRLIAVTAGTVASSLSGGLKKSYDLLAKVVHEEQSEAVETRVWALGTLAEMAVRLGKLELADKHFQKAHQLDRRSPWLTRSFADHLLNTGRPEFVLRLLENREEHFLLHWLLAARAVHGKTDEWQETLARYQKVQGAGHGHAHGREAARFQLEVKKNAHAALHAIKYEVGSQREPDDLLIALRCARAAGDKTFFKELAAWIQQEKLEDVRLAKLISSGQN